MELVRTITALFIAYIYLGILAEKSYGNRVPWPDGSNADHIAKQAIQDERNKRNAGRKLLYQRMSTYDHNFLTISIQFQ